MLRNRLKIDEQFAESYKGIMVYTQSKKPFKSGSKIATVKGVTTNMYTNRLRFYFEEDDSVVEVRACRIWTGEVNP